LLGKGFGMGASMEISYEAGNFSFSYGFGATAFGKHYATGSGGWEFRNSLMAGWDDGDTGVSLGINIWRGTDGMKEVGQQTGVVGFRSGDFSMTYENDGNPFDKKAVLGGILGDGHDRWRTAAMTFNIGDFHAGFNLFTGERTKGSYAGSKDGSHQDKETMEGRKYPKGLPGRIFNKIPVGDPGGYGANLPLGKVDENMSKPRHRFGGAYIGWGNYRVGINSDRHVRHPIQDIFAHYFISPQPGFSTLSGGISPYFQYQTRNKFTSW
jgi:hypothetical protein